MGRGDKGFVDDGADAVLRRMLTGGDQPPTVDPPLDIVARTLRQLPPYPPARAGALAVRRRRVRAILSALVAGALLLVVALGAVALAAGEVPLAGSLPGVAGRAALLLALLVKPLLNTIGAAGPLPWSIAALTIAGGGWLWWRLARRTLVPHYAEVRS